MSKAPWFVWPAVVVCTCLTAQLEAAHQYALEWDGTLGTSFFANSGDQEFASRQILFSGGFGSGGMQLPNITADFDADKEFTVQLSAPAGQKFSVVPPNFPDTDEVVVKLNVNIASDSGMLGEMINGSLDGFSFTGLDVAAPTVDFGNFQWGSSSFFGGNNPQFAVIAELRFPGPTPSPFSFTGVTLNFTAPSSMDSAFVDDDPFGWIEIVTSGRLLGDEPGDPGAWVSLVPVPEPSGLALAGTALYGLMAARRRIRINGRQKND